MLWVASGKPIPEHLAKKQFLGQSLYPILFHAILSYPILFLFSYSIQIFLKILLLLSLSLVFSQLFTYLEDIFRCICVFLNFSLYGYLCVDNYSDIFLCAIFHISDVNFFPFLFLISSFGRSFLIQISCFIKILFLILLFFILIFLSYFSIHFKTPSVGPWKAGCMQRIP